MTYDEALEYIHGTLKFGSVLGLDNIRYLLGLLGNPQEKLKIIHVAGTNGKGSTCAFIAEILRVQGFRVGMYISPYVEEFCERIQIDRENISRDDMAKYTEKVKAAIDKMTAGGGECEAFSQCPAQRDYSHPTEFEIITAAAFLYFFDAGCDFVVLEVGLGGALDATNVIKSPYVSVITSISMDHMGYLGDTIEEITAAKCGIIKQNGITVCYPKQNEISARLIARHCYDLDADFIMPFDGGIEIKDMDITGTVFDFGKYKNLNIKLLGEHQVYNAVTAIVAVEVLIDFWGFDIDAGSIYNGLASTVFHGRFEVISDDPLIIVDGAHNLDGVTAFVSAVDEYLYGYEKIIVMGMLRDKQYSECAAEAAKIADTFIATTPDNPRALPAAELAEEAEEYCDNVIVVEDKFEAVELAKSLARRGRSPLRPVKNQRRVEQSPPAAICVCGSLFLIGGIK